MNAIISWPAPVYRSDSNLSMLKDNRRSLQAENGVFIAPEQQVLFFANALSISTDPKSE